jgi:tetratricopeptide (TPR) repeat protein
MPGSPRPPIIDAIAAGDFARAESLCRQLAAAGDSGEAAYLLAVLRHAEGRVDAALALFGDAVGMLPSRADVACNHAAVLRQAGRLDAAIAEWRRTLALAPDHPDALYNLARALTDTGALAEAAELYAVLLRRQPGHRDAAFNRGNVLYRLGEFEQAAEALAEVTAGHPAFAAGWVNRGMAVLALGRRAEAEALYRTALTVDPGSVDGHWNLAVLLLADGRWHEGLAEFEWRLALPEAPKPGWPRPRWRGGDPAGLRILLWNDQGRGDAIQFLRYAPALAAGGARVFACVQRDLKALAATVPGLEAAFAFDDPLPDFDAHAPLLSLPLLLGHDGPARGWFGPYIAAEPEGRTPRSAARPAVGLVWAGNPGHANDANRSMALAELAPLLDIDGIDWVSLQAGTAARQLDGSPWAGRARDLSPLLTDFAVTAGMVRGLDLVITVDTAVAHLAGAMDKPAWLMLPAVGTDWRWGREGMSTPWYPSLRLFRQAEAHDAKAHDAKAHDWGPVVAEIAARLGRLHRPGQPKVTESPLPT